MTLGTEASISIKVMTGRRAQPGASSVKYTAVARLRGSAIASPSRDDTKVPTMQGRGPKSLFTGFQWERPKKRQPKTRSDKPAPRHNSSPRMTTSASTIIAIAQVRSLKTLSPLRLGGGRIILRPGLVWRERAAFIDKA